MAKLLGNWKIVDIQNMSEYLAHLGVPEAHQKKLSELVSAGKDSNLIEIGLGEGKKISMKVSANGNVIRDRCCTLGEEFEDTEFDDRKLKMTVTVESDTKVVEKETGPYEAEIVSEVDGDKLTSTMTSGGKTCTIICQRA